MTKQLPIIGSKYTGQHEVFKDTRAGVYSESCPPLLKQESHLQAMLLDHAERMAAKRPRPIRQVELPDETALLKSDAARNLLKRSADYFSFSDHAALELQIQRGPRE